MVNNLEEMNVWMHFDELRKRLMHSMIAIVVGVIISIISAEFLLGVLARPIGGFEKLLSLQVTENLSVYFRMILLGRFRLALHFILIQLYLLIGPELTQAEQSRVVDCRPLCDASVHRRG